jgi:hypothetical protein
MNGTARTIKRMKFTRVLTQRTSRFPLCSFGSTKCVTRTPNPIPTTKAASPAGRLSSQCRAAITKPKSNGRFSKLSHIQTSSNLISRILLHYDVTTKTFVTPGAFRFCSDRLGLKPSARNRKLLRDSSPIRMSLRSRLRQNSPDVYIRAGWLEPIYNI